MIATARRAVGIARQSQGDGESVAQQLARIEEACERDGLALVTVHREQDVSGGTPLAKRKGLLAAVEAVEAGEADVVVAAYFDRLARSLKVQAELVERVEKAGGKVLALDTGEVTNGSAGQWLSATMLGMVAEYHRRTTAERTRAAQERAIARGAAPWPSVPPGYVRGADGVLELDPAVAPAMRKAFAVRAGGGSLSQAREPLTAAGVTRSIVSISRLLRSRVYLGELHFGTFDPNLAAHPPLVDPQTFAAAQAVVVPRGPQAASERLLARLGVLRCAACDRALVVGTSRSGGQTFHNYRCPPAADCKAHASISAPKIEEHIATIVRAELADAPGRASMLTEARDTAERAERIDGELSALIAALTEAGVMTEPASIAAVGTKRGERDEARAAGDAASARAGVSAILLGRDWDDLSADARRELIAAIVVDVRVAKGRGLDRARVRLARDVALKQ